MMPRTALVAALLMMAGPTAAQVQTDTDQNPYPIVTTPSSAALPAISPQGRTAKIGDARIGERQTGAEAGPGFQPLGRIQNRIVSRVDSRLRTRIDRDYDPDASTRPLSGITTATTSRARKSR